MQENLIELLDKRDIEGVLLRHCRGIDRMADSRRDAEGAAGAQ